MIDLPAAKHSGISTDTSSAVAGHLTSISSLPNKRSQNPAISYVSQPCSKKKAIFSLNIAVRMWYKTSGDTIMSHCRHGAWCSGKKKLLSFKTASVESLFFTVNSSSVVGDCRKEIEAVFERAEDELRIVYWQSRGT